MGSRDKCLDDFHKAIQIGDVDTVQSFLDEGCVGVNEKLNFLTPIGTAAEYRQTCVAAALLRHGCDVNCGDTRLKSPLYIASRMGNLGLVQLLLKYNPNLELKHLNGNTALHEATVRGYTDIVEELIRAGSDVKSRNSGKETALHIACLKGHAPIVKILLRAGADINVKKGTLGVEPIHLAAFGGHPEVLALLLDAGVDINRAKEDNARTPLHIAAIHNCVEFTEALIKHGCQLDPISAENEEAKTPLLKAVELGNITVAQILLDAGADPNKGDHWGVTPLLTVILQGKYEMAKLLIQSGSSVNQACRNEMTPFSASLRDSAQITVLLLMANCKLTGRDKENLAVAIEQTSDSERKSLLTEIQRVITQPRTLQHLCRTLIRNFLGQGCQFKLDSLKIPRNLKGYLKYNSVQV